MDLLIYRTIFSFVGFYFWHSSGTSAQIVVHTGTCVDQKGSGETHHCHIHGVRSQISQNQTFNPQVVIRTSEAAEVGNHSSQYAEQDKTRIGNPSNKFCIQAFTLSEIQASSRSITQIDIQIWCLFSWNQGLNNSFLYTHLNCPFFSFLNSRSEPSRFFKKFFQKISLGAGGQRCSEGNSRSCVFGQQLMLCMAAGQCKTSGVIRMEQA